MISGIKATKIRGSAARKWGQIQPQMGVSIHGGHPIGRWMVYHGKSSSNG